MISDWPSFSLFRSHVFGGADQTSVGSQTRIAEQPCNAKVGELDIPFGSKQKICRLQVAVNHAVVMCVLQLAAKLDRGASRLAPIEAAAGLQLVLQIRARHELHCVIGVAVLNAMAKQPHDIWMLELFEGLNLNAKSFTKTFFVGKMRIEQLDCCRFVGVYVDRLVDRAHPAAAELFDDFVWAKLFELYHTMNGEERSGKLLYRTNAAVHLRRAMHRRPSGYTLPREADPDLNSSLTGHGAVRKACIAKRLLFGLSIEHNPTKSGSDEAWPGDVEALSCNSNRSESPHFLRWRYDESFCVGQSQQGKCSRQIPIRLQPAIVLVDPRSVGLLAFCQLGRQFRLPIVRFAVVVGELLIADTNALDIRW